MIKVERNQWRSKNFLTGNLLLRLSFNQSLCYSSHATCTSPWTSYTLLKDLRSRQIWGLMAFPLVGKIFTSSTQVGQVNTSPSASQLKNYLVTFLLLSSYVFCYCYVYTFKNSFSIIFIWFWKVLKRLPFPHLISILPISLLKKYLMLLRSNNLKL